MKNRFILLLCTCVFVWSPARAEKKLVTEFYKGTGEFFDLKPREVTFTPFYVHLIESGAFPGGGHISNGHISKSAMTIITSAFGLIFGFSKYFDAGSQKERANLAMPNGNSVNAITNKHTYDASRIYYANQSEYIQLLFIGGFTLIDSFFESIIMWSRPEPDDTTWFVGSTFRTAGYRSTAQVDHNAINALKGLGLAQNTSTYNRAQKRSQKGLPNLLIGVEGGRTTQKRIMLDIGMESTRVKYDWWFGVPFSKYGLGEGKVLSNLSPAFGFRWISYDIVSDNSTVANPTNNSFNKFNMTTGDFWTGVVWKKGLRKKLEVSPRFVESIAAGLGFFWMTLGTTWNHPTAFDTGTGEGSQGVVSQRAGKVGVMGSYGIRSWASANLWKFVSLNLDFEYFVAEEAPGDAISVASRMNFWELQLNAVANF